MLKIKTLNATPSANANNDAEADVVFHASSTPGAPPADLEARIVKLSWHCSEGFCTDWPCISQRLRLISYRVGGCSDPKLPIGPHARPLAKALSDDRLDAHY